MNGQGKVVENASMVPQLSFVPKAAHQANIPLLHFTMLNNLTPILQGETIETEEEQEAPL